jgi:hypothetical protein
MYIRSFLCLYIIILFTFSSCKEQYSENLKNDREQWNLKGDVKSLSEINYSNAGKLMTNVFFNKEGYVTKQESFNPDGSLIRRWIYTYDVDNHKLTRKCYVQKDSLSYIMYYHYNEQWKIASTNLIKSNGTEGALDKIQYNNELNRSFEMNFGENNVLENSIAYKYNNNQQIIEELFVDYIIHNKQELTYKYNNKGLKEEVSSWSGKGCLLMTTEYTYLENKLIDAEYIYNDKNKLISTTLYKYNKQRNKIKILKLSPCNKILNEQTMQYKYDRKGNWTYLFGYTNGKLKAIMSHTIEYY